VARRGEREASVRAVLNHLRMNGAQERIVTACRTIRRYAARGPGEAAGLLTYSYELDAFCELRKFDIAWRQLRRRELMLLL
jgi:hypothetical protein